MMPFFSTYGHRHNSIDKFFETFLETQVTFLMPYEKVSMMRWNSIAHKNIERSSLKANCKWFTDYLGWQCRQMCLSATPLKRQTFLSVADMSEMSSRHVGDMSARPVADTLSYMYIGISRVLVHGWTMRNRPEWNPCSPRSKSLSLNIE